MRTKSYAEYHSRAKTGFRSRRQFHESRSRHGSYIWLYLLDYLQFSSISIFQQTNAFRLLHLTYCTRSLWWPITLRTVLYKTNNGMFSRPSCVHDATFWRCSLSPNTANRQPISKMSHIFFGCSHEMKNFCNYKIRFNFTSPVSVGPPTPLNRSS
jgi:hypothetical protein